MDCLLSVCRFMVQSELNLQVCCSLIDMYSKCGEIQKARRIFDNMVIRDLLSWNGMISGYVACGFMELALDLYGSMRLTGVEPDLVTLNSVMDAYCRMGLCDEGKQIHAYILRNSLSSAVSIMNALISMYGKCGCVNSAFLIFSNMTTKDLVSWNTMIGGLAMHGKGEAALQVLNEMTSSGFCPDSSTLTSILSACNHSGLVNEGIKVFHGLTRDFKLVPKMEHYACLVDMLARAGQLNEALDVVMNMRFMPDKHIWGTLLVACQMQQNLEVAKLAAENLVSLEPENAGHYVTLSNIYMEDGKWDDAMKVRRLMESRGLMKLKGSSWIEGGS
ncbi:hypothetical protein RDABS01_004940 [Bienertia sinuspersici]